MPNIYTLSVSSSLGLQPKSSAYVSPIRLSLSSGLHLQPVASTTILRNIVVTVSAGFSLTPSASFTARRNIVLTVSAGLVLQPSLPVFTHNAVRNITVTTGLGLQPALTLVANRIYTVSVSSSLGLQPSLSILRNSVYSLSVSAEVGLQPALTLNLSKLLSVSVSLGLQPSASIATVRSFTVSAGLGLRASATAGRTIILTVSSSLGFRAAPGEDFGLQSFSVSTGLGLQAIVTATKQDTLVSSTLGLTPAVTCVVVSAPAIGGPSVPLYSGLSGSYPLTFAETPSGVVLMANGVDPMLRWDALSGQADVAGIQPPVTAPTITASGLGTITGLRYAFVRFIDQYGNPSNLSPAGGPIQCGRDGLIDSISLNPTTGQVIIGSRGHGLPSNSSVILAGISGLPLTSAYTITALDQDNFSLNGVTLSQGIWTGGGSWSQGAASVTYSSIPSPSQSKVTAIQLLRNLEGNLDVLYVDATVTPGTSALTSSMPDDQLAQQEAVVLKAEDGTPLALRYAVPPSNRPFLINYLGRVFAAGDITYFAGCVSVTAGSNIIQGIGTQWSSSLTGRSIYVKGAARSYGILSINVSAQTCVLDRSYSDPSSLFSTYLIRSSPADRKLLQWSEPDNPEAWPAWNALAIPEDNDEIVGLFVRGTFLFIVEKRHIWRFQFTDDPGRTGHCFLAAERGALNHRVIACVDEGVFLLDESGVHVFDGTGTEPISEPVQAVFHSDGLTLSYQIDWSADTTLWHASVDPVRTTIRWFVAVQGAVGLTTALCYNYRIKRWWWEQYPVQVTSSCTGTMAEAPNVGIPSGFRRPLVGSECRVVLVLGEGGLDLAPDRGTLRGTVGSADATSLTDPNASFDSSLPGTPVTLVANKGAGQTRIISAVSAQTITIVKPWNITPDSTTIYQIGGIPWAWRSGWWDIEDEEGQTNRDLALSYQPLASTTLVSCQFFYDHSTNPYVWAMDTNRDGVITATGQPDITFDLTSSDVIPGWRIFRQARHTERYAYSDRYVQIYLAGVQNDQTVRIYQVSLRGVDQEGI